MLETEQILKALADNSRLRIVHALSEGTYNVQELTRLLGLGQSTVSHHLKVLAQAEIVEQHKEGTWVYYGLKKNSELSYEIVKNLLSALRNSSEHSLHSIFLDDVSTVQSLLNERRQETQAYFEESAETWNELRQEATRENSQWLKELAEHIPSTGSFLELGCGAGALLELLLPRTGKSIAVDYSDSMLLKCKHAINDSNLELRLGYLEHLPVADCCIDHAASYMVLHYLANPGQAFQSAFRVLNNGGSLHIVDLQKHSNEYMRERFAHQWLGFDKEQLVHWAMEAGFTDIVHSSLGKEKEAFLLTCKK